jgi:hypothetical protein
MCFYPCCIGAREAASRPGAVISTEWPSRIAMLAAAAEASNAASLFAYGPLVLPHGFVNGH